MDDTGSPRRLSRRAALLGSTLLLTPQCLKATMGEDRSSTLKVGLITDLHHADKETSGTRHYRQTLGKLEEASQQFSQQQIQFAVELGDFIDAADSVQTELGYLQTVNEAFTQITNDRHYVLGNHCVDTLTKDEFLAEVGQEQSYYSFDRDGVHFIVLDACFRRDGEPYGRKNFRWTDTSIPAKQLEWLRADLSETDKPVVVFVHQRLDVSNDHGVQNNAEVREILERSGLVLAVFQGHSHQNDLKEIHGIPYCTLVAMVEGSGAENNGYSVLSIHSDNTLELTGFRKQETHRWGSR